VSSLLCSVRKLCVQEFLAFLRKLLQLLETHSTCTNFSKLSDTNSIRVHDIIPLLPVLIGILTFSASFLSLVFLLNCTFLQFMPLFRLFHIPVRHIKEAVIADGLR
jgi:hypothetical protein